MNQNDDHELKGWARSIDALFAEKRVDEADQDPAAGMQPIAPSRPQSQEPRPQPQPQALTDEARPQNRPEVPGDPVEARLEEAVSRYLLATSEQREELVGPMREAVAEARVADALDALAGAMDSLLVQPVPDPEAERLAGDLMDAGVRERMAHRLGEVRDEHERAGLVRAYARLGDPMAGAIAEALTETDDRLARKTYVSALVALGHSGMSVVEEMMDDARWFVVRNGVTVLGEVGGAPAIAHLTGTLAHGDPRVRRETVRSLAKVGGADAAQLVVGMLSDADADVRAAAARAVGVLKAERAFKNLLTMLDEGDEDSVIEQVIRALGQLGDPAAVPLLEKRALGSFFSKPSLEIRIAGLRALGSIGTPHAMSLVEAARDDKDPAVRAAVQKALSAK